VLDTLGSFQGYPFEGEFDAAFEKAVDKIVKMCEDIEKERLGAPRTKLSSDELMQLMAEERAKYEELLAVERAKADQAEQERAKEKEERVKADQRADQAEKLLRAKAEEERAKANEESGSFNSASDLFN
jgi:hypothetical protein